MGGEEASGRGDEPNFDSRFGGIEATADNPTLIHARRVHSHWPPVESRISQLWSLEYRRTRADLIEVYKIIHRLSTVRFNTFFEFSQNKRTRGHSLKLHKKRAMTDFRQHFFSDRIVNKWNTLSEDIVSASSLNNFKGKLQRLHNDGSSTEFFKSAWPSGPSQFPGRPNPVSYIWYLVYPRTYQISVWMYQQMMPGQIIRQAVPQC